MPRGVPKNGVRRTRAVIEAEQSASDGSAVAVGPGDDPAGDFVAPEVEEEAPVEVLTSDQREIKRLRDMLAREKGRKDVEVEYEEPAAGETILIHFLEDGLTVNGVVKYRGDELEFPVGSGAYRDTFDRNGVTWLALRGQDFAQIERWGKVMFRPGPWPGKTYADGVWEPLKAIGADGRVSAPTPEELEAAERARRKRLAPRLPQQV